MSRTIAYGVVCGVIAAGCGNSSGNRSPGGKQPSPANLRQFESDAEAMSAFAAGPNHVPDWTSCKGTYDQAFSLWQQLKHVVTGAGASAASVSAIDDALTAYLTDVLQQRQRDAETDANNITATVPDLFDLFVYPAPTDTLRLDGTFRQLQIDAEYSDWINCAKDLGDTRAVWSRLKPLVQAQAPSRPDVKGSSTVDADLETTLQTAERLIADDGGVAHDSASLQAQAQMGLDLTDTCEQIFK